MIAHDNLHQYTNVWFRVSMISLLEHLVPPIVNGFVITLVLMSTYFVQRRMERKELRRSLADMLGVEVLNIAELINPIDMGRAAITPEPQISVEIYRGLVSSGNIAKFDVEIQKKVREFYGHGGKHRFEMMRSQIKDVIKMVDDFRRKNRRHVYLF